MKLTKAVALLALTSSLGAQAASSSTSTTTISNIYQKLKESPLSMSVLSETASAKGMEGFINTNILYLGYKLSDKDSLKLENRLLVDRRTGKEDTRMNRMVLSYNRGKILTQDQHGINMSAKLEQRLYPAPTDRNGRNQYGLTRASVKVSHEFNSLFSLSGSLFGAKTQRINKAAQDTNDTYAYASFVENFQINDKWYVAFIQEPFIARDVAGKQTANIYNVIETGYQLTPELVGAVYTANTLENDDGTKLSIRNLGTATRAQEYAFYFMLSAF